MTKREKELHKALRKAALAVDEAIQWTPSHYGAKDKLEQASSLIDSFRAWFEQTHA